VEAPAPHAPPDPQQGQRPEAHEPHPPIVSAHQDDRQRAPEHGQGQTAHRQGASEQLARATHGQGDEAAPQQPPQGGAEGRQDGGVRRRPWGWYHPEATTQRPETRDERQHVDGRGQTDDQALHT
jgi:hypothetical protein